MRPSPSLFAVVFSAISVLLSSSGCSKRSPSAAAKRGAPCILIVTLSEARADGFGAYGGDHVFTPVFDEMAASGLLLEDLQATAPLSAPAHASILTGQYPPEHGLRLPGGALGDSAQTLATAMLADGYRTAAFLASAELATTGLRRGFERFDAPAPGVQATGSGATGSHRLRPSAFETPPQSGTRRGEAVIDASVEWLENTLGSPKIKVPDASSPRGASGSVAVSAARLDRPFFLWVQLADPLFRDSPEQTRFGGGRVIEPYEAEIAYTDLQLGRLLAFLDRNGLRERTLVVVAGAYGTELGSLAGDDPGLVLSDETLHVPGVLNWKGHIPAGKRIAETLSLTALAPTLAALAGLESAFPELVALRRIDALRGLPLQPPARVYAESLWPQAAYGLPALRGWADARCRFVSGLGVQPRGEAGQESPPACSPKEGEERLLDLDAAMLPPPTDASPPAQRLEASFSLGGDLDRREFVQFWQRVARRMRNPKTSDGTLAEDCRRLVEGRPDHAPFHTWLGIAHALRKETTEAVQSHQRALELSPGDPLMLSNLGMAWLEAGDIAKAIDHLEDAYLARPDDAALRDNLASVLMRTGVALARNKAFNDAVACMTRVLYLQPDNPVAHVNMGSVYQQMDRPDLATACFRRALELRPSFQPALLALRHLQSKDSP